MNLEEKNLIKEIILERFSPDTIVERDYSKHATKEQLESISMFSFYLTNKATSFDFEEIQFFLLDIRNFDSTRGYEMIVNPEMDNGVGNIKKIRIDFKSKGMSQLNDTFTCDVSDHFGSTGADIKLNEIGSLLEVISKFDVDDVEVDNSVEMGDKIVYIKVGKFDKSLNSLIDSIKQMDCIFGTEMMFDITVGGELRIMWRLRNEFDLVKSFDYGICQ